MKIFSFTLFLYFSLFAACVVYAGNNTLTSNYPAPNGSYNKVVIATQTGTNVTCNASNSGLLFMDTTTNTLKLCATNNGSAVTVPSGETCFNRFANAPIVPVCPAPYVQAMDNGVPITDPFQTDATHTVNSVVCCYGGSTTLPT